MKLLPWSPSSSLVHVLILWLSLAVATPALRRCSAAVAVSDGQTLLSIKAMISDPLGNLNSWNNSQHYCNWEGVTCGGRRHPDKVQKLILNSAGLSGEIPPQITNLSSLRKLDISDNAFGGGIPPELGKLSMLHYLNLSVNYLDGDIPVALTQCSRLRLLQLSANNLTGVIPKSVDLLKEMQVLNLLQNSLTGRIPASIGNITGLQLLDLSHNQLEGGIPETIEMFTGRKATDDMFKDEENLHNYVKTTPPTHVHSIVDQRMLLMEDDNDEGQLNAEDLSKHMVAVQESIISVLDIGLACSKEDPKDRMTISEVIKQLHDVRDMFLRPRSHFRRN